MPNFKVFQDDANALKTKLFGDNSGNPTPVSVNASGQILSEIAGGSVNSTVTGTVDYALQENTSDRQEYTYAVLNPGTAATLVAYYNARS